MNVLFKTGIINGKIPLRYKFSGTKWKNSISVCLCPTYINFQCTLHLKHRKYFQKCDQKFASSHNKNYIDTFSFGYVTFMGSFIWIFKGICGTRPKGLAPEEIQQPDLNSIYSSNQLTLWLHYIVSFINQWY